ncbi:MAG: radical SAM protein [Promethearchaeota archaeon]
MPRKIKETVGKSLVIGKLPIGCQYCIQGQKLVLFVTGLCNKPKNCFWYCPLSENRRDRDVIYANELSVTRDSDILLEAQLMSAKGVGITGGEPLLFPQRVNHYIRLLKDSFGARFHIHLYTNGIFLTEKLLSQLIDAGLDEIRFQPCEDISEQMKWAEEYELDVGIEVPVIPTEDSINKIKYFVRLLENIDRSFINLNEFEFTESQASELKNRGFVLKEGTFAAVQGSESTAVKLLDWILINSNITAHYCPIVTKDQYQFKNRLRRRAKNVAKPFEKVTEDGLLLKGVIKGEFSKEALNELRNRLIREFNVPPMYIGVNLEKKRLEISGWILEELSSTLKELGFTCGIVEEYPTVDALEVLYIPL